jgi:ATP synthase protein I
MRYADAVGRDARRVVAAQAMLALLVAAGFGIHGGWPQLVAAVYGGAITILLTLWLAWRVRRAGNAGGGLASIYSGAIARYALAAAGIAAGIGWLRLAPLPLLGSFAVTQFGFMVLWRRC